MPTPKATKVGASVHTCKEVHMQWIERTAPTCRAMGLALAGWHAPSTRMLRRHLGRSSSGRGIKVLAVCLFSLLLLLRQQLDQALAQLAKLVLQARGEHGGCGARAGEECVVWIMGGGHLAAKPPHSQETKRDGSMLNCMRTDAAGAATLACPWAMWREPPLQ